MSKTAEERFWDQVSPEPNTGCWLWMGLDEEDAAATKDSVERALDKLGGICYNRRKRKEDPEAAEADKLMWLFVRKYREYSHHPANWRLCQWWKAFIATHPDAEPADVVDEIVFRYREGAGGAYFNAALELFDA